MQMTDVKKLIQENRDKRRRRVRLIDLPDAAQAVIMIEGDKHIEMQIYMYNSHNLPVQFIAPLQFETKKTRNKVFRNGAQLAKFAKKIIVTQMAAHDIALNTDNFKTDK